MNLAGKEITLHDMSLRDGMHSVAHQFTVEQMVALATALDRAKVPMLEVTHGDGLAGTSITYGFGRHSDEEYLKAVVPKMRYSKVSVLLLPGIGTVEDLKMARAAVRTPCGWPPTARRRTWRSSTSATPPSRASTPWAS